MLIIRLQRRGATNNPDFRIVLAEKHRAATKKVLEIFGQYNPQNKSFNLNKQDQLLLWVKRNVELSPTVRNLLIEKKLITGKKVRAWRPKPKEKTETPAPASGATTPAATPAVST